MGSPNTPRRRGQPWGAPRPIFQRKIGLEVPPWGGERLPLWIIRIHSSYPLVPPHALPHTRTMFVWGCVGGGPSFFFFVPFFPAYIKNLYMPEKRDPKGLKKK